jgi:hypothetical protein
MIVASKILPRTKQDPTTRNINNTNKAGKSKQSCKKTVEKTWNKTLGKGKAVGDGRRL